MGTSRYLSIDYLMFITRIDSIGDLTNYELININCYKFAVDRLFRIISSYLEFDSHALFIYLFEGDQVGNDRWI